MKINKLIVLPLAVATLALGSFGAASAQTIGPMVALQFGTNGLTNPLTASSSDAVIARLLLDTTGSTEAVRISSLPFNIVTGSGAIASSLQNCRVYNESNLSVALNTPASANTTMFSGINNIAFNSPLILQPNTLTTLSLRCDVNGTLVSGGTFTVNMNTANVIATGASTGLPAAVTIRGAVVVPAGQDQQRQQDRRQQDQCGGDAVQTQGVAHTERRDPLVFLDELILRATRLEPHRQGDGEREHTDRHRERQRARHIPPRGRHDEYRRRADRA